MYNGENAFSEAYEGYLADIHEGYSERIPLDPIEYYVGNPSVLRANYSKAIEKGRKAIEEHSIRSKPEKSPGWRKDLAQRLWQEKQEYNSYLYNAWLLVGKSQFYSADMLSALNTFAFMDRLYKNDPQVRLQANIWQSRCYNQLGWYEEASNILRRLSSSVVSASSDVRCNYDIARVNNALGRGDIDSAITVLHVLAGEQDGDFMTSRTYYLLGQLLQEKGSLDDASWAYARAKHYATNISLELSAGIRSISVSSSDLKSQISLLKSLSHRARYSDFLDAIMLSIGDKYISLGDTLQALSAYSLGAKSSKENKMDYALNLIHQGDIFFSQRKYIEASDSYSKALPVISDHYVGKPILARRNIALSRLVDFYNQLQREDSLRLIASRPMDDIMNYADSLANEARRQKEKKEDDEYFAAYDKSRRDNASSNRIESVLPYSNGQFYFYNRELLEAGRREFRRVWGNIALTDGWIHNGKPLTHTENTATYNNTVDSIASSQESSMDENSPLSPAYYLKDLPLTKDKLAKSDSIMAKSLYEMASVLLLDFDDKRSAEAQYLRLINTINSSPLREDAVYRLLLLYASTGDFNKAEIFRKMYIKEYPKGDKYQRLNTDDFLHTVASRDSMMENSYQKAFANMKRGNMSAVQDVYNDMMKRFPDNPNRDKLTMLSALASARSGDISTMIKRLNTVKTDYPKSDVYPMATYILSQIENGRKPVSGDFNWLQNIYTNMVADSVAGDSVQYQYETTGQKYEVVILYPRSYKPSGTVYFAITAFNYSRFTQDDITITMLNTPTQEGVMLSGINNVQEYIKVSLQKDGLISTALPDAIILPMTKDDFSLYMSSGNLSRYVDDLKKHINQSLYKIIKIQSQLTSK